MSDDTLPGPPPPELPRQTPPHTPYPPYIPSPLPPTPPAQPGWGQYPPQYRAYPPPPYPRHRGIPWYAWLIGGCLGLLALVVVACAVLFGIAAGALVNLSHQVTQTASSSQTLRVTGTPRLDIQSDTGAISIQPGPAGSVTVSAVRSAADLSVAQARRELGAITLGVTQTGNVITIVSTTPGGSSAHFGSSQSQDLTITVPARTDISLSAGVGVTSITGVRGLIMALTEVGNLSLSGVTLADGSSLGAQIGTVSCVCALAPRASVVVRAQTGAVSLTMPPGTATALSASTRLGHITISGWPITPQQNGTFGASASGQLGGAGGGTLSVSVDTGNIMLAQGTDASIAPSAADPSTTP